MNNSHLINAAYKLPFGKMSGYAYLLDFEDNSRTPLTEGVGAGPGITNFDSDTWGCGLAVNIDCLTTLPC
ncbi:MAG: hypothetical protein AB2598_03240 [Candidatus Thiodiazotropha sp.]